MKIIRSLLLLLLSVTIIVIVVIAVINRKHLTCEKIEFIIHYDGSSLPVDEDELLAKFKKENIKIIGHEISLIDETAIFNSLKSHAYIKEIAPIRFQGKKLLLELFIRKPILHLYSSDGQQFFIDSEGKFLPFNKKVQERLLVANGNIHDKYQSQMSVNKASQVVKTIYDIATIVDTNDFYHAYFKQIYVNQSDGIEIIPSVGRHIILMKTGDNVAEKLYQFENTCQQGLRYMSLNQYSMFDLRYKNRIIAKKR